MTWAWTVPAALAVIGVFATMLVARRTADEAAALRRELGRVADLQPALLDVRDDMVVAAEAVRRMRDGR